MKNFFTCLLLVSSFSVLADSTKLIEQCRSAGTEKLQRMAQNMNIDLRDEDITECGVDNRALNPFKYVWFCADVKSVNGNVHLSVTTQKPPFRKCF